MNIAVVMPKEMRARGAESKGEVGELRARERAEG